MSRNITESFAKSLKEITAGILQAVPALKIYLFGSYAYGVPNENSDIDLYVVIPDDYNESILNMTLKTLKSIEDDDDSLPLLSLFYVKESAFLNYCSYSSFEKTICEKGILLHGN